MNIRVSDTPLMRILVVAAMSVGAMLGSPAAALADCGQHALDTVFTPKALAAEAIPLTPDVFIPTGGQYILVGRRPFAVGALNASLDSCPDAKPDTANAPGDLATMWQQAMLMQNMVSIYEFEKSGSLKEPAGCLALDRAAVQDHFADRWTSTMGPLLADVMNPSPEHGAVMKERYFPHVAKIWNANAAKIGVTLPGLSVNTMNWYMGFYQAHKIASAHLPDGLHCTQM